MSEDWRREAKELGISLYHKKKVDVLLEIENRKPKDIKVIIDPKEATVICNKALRAVAVERGLNSDENILIERWFVNCKRKGIVFRGKTKMKIDKDLQVAAKEKERARIFSKAESASPDTVLVEETIDLTVCSYKEIQAKAKLIGVKASGRKEDIIKRIQEKENGRTDETAAEGAATEGDTEAATGQSGDDCSVPQTA